MRVVIDGRESGTSTGRYVDKLVEYLHKLKPQLEIVVLTKPSRVDYLKSIAPDFDVVRSNYREFGFSEQLGFWRQLEKLKPDLVHFPMVQQPVLYRGKVVSGIHDLTTTRFRNPAKNWLVFTLKQAVYKWLIKYAARKSKRVITISQFVKNDVAQYCNIEPAKIVVTYPAADKIDDKAEAMKKLSNKDFLLYVGRPLPHKNLNRLVDAFAITRQSHPSLLMVFAGRFDKNYKMLREYALRRGAQGVIFTDFISDGRLRWLYQNATAYTFPSLSEGFGLPGLEAMLYGLPVVSSSATCLPEIYQDAAVYFDPQNVEDMADKINQVLDDPALRRRLAQKGKKVAGQYSWRRMAKQTLDVYTKVLRS